MSRSSTLTPRRRIFRKPVLLLLGIAAFAAVLGIDGPLHHFQGQGTDFGSRPAHAAAAALLMAIWWITEATSIYLTALVPLALFPLFQVAGEGWMENLAAALLPYVDPYIFLFLGGMGIAAAMQQWNLHSRIALNILWALGARPQSILAGMLLATAAISLWISNTATAAMMLPIGMALIAQIEKQTGGERRELFGGALMLAIAYGANIGGMGTKIGTAPNMVFCGFVARELHQEVSFLQFLAIGLPFVLLFLPVAWLALWFYGRADAPRQSAGREAILEQLEKLGPMSRGEVIVLGVFSITALLWILSDPLHSGWLSPLLEAPFLHRFHVKYQKAHTEAGIALLGMLSLLMIPAGRREGRLQMALSLRQLRAVPWETLILLGGGFALASGIERSGLSVWMGDQMSRLQQAPLLLQYLGVCLVTVYFGAVASNVATTSVMLVVLKSSAVQDMAPLMAAAALAASCDFMLPAGTPPNAIVFGSGYLTIPRMARTGFSLDLLSALLLALWGYTGVRWVLRN